MPHLIAFAICDDIRAERNGTVTLVGYYGQALRVGTFPSLLPKLCFLAQFDSLAAAKRVAVRVVGPSGNIILEVPPQTCSAMSVSDVPPEYRFTQVALQVAPMQLPEGGVYRVEYAFEGEPPLQTSFFVGIDPSLLSMASPTDIAEKPRRANGA